MAFKLSPVLNDQQFSDAGILLSGGKIEAYLAGSSTPATTYTSDTGAVAQSNPIILNTRGEADNLIYLTTGFLYKLVLKDSSDNVLRTFDNIEGVNDSSFGFDQWINSGSVPTFINATQFSVIGDQTNSFQINRRVKLLTTAGTVYGYISSSVFGALTTVTVVLDSGVLDNGLSDVQLGLITPTQSSLYAIKPIDLSPGAPTWTTDGEFTVTDPQKLGYGTGAGGAVTQLTSKATAVTLNKPVGNIIVNNAALAAGATVAFKVNNSLMTSSDLVVLGTPGGGTVSAYNMWCQSIAGSFDIYLKNISAGSLSEAFVISFAIIKGVTT